MSDDRNDRNDRNDRRALVATPVARDRAIEKLQDHYAQNHVEVEEFERLVELAERARTDEELVRLFDGLPALEPASADTALTASSKKGNTDVTVPGRVSTTISATLGSTSRGGHWRVPRRVVVKATLGSVDLDLCDAELSGDTVVEVRALLGNVTVIVPEGLAVECEGSALLGSFDHHEQPAASRRDRRTLKIVGKATLGSVDIVVKKRSGVLAEIKSAMRGLLGP